MSTREQFNRIGTELMFVSFGYGCGAYVDIPIYEGYTIEENIKLRIHDATGYIRNGQKFKRLDSDN